jgi:flagellar basal-body rod protein FlgC
MSFFDAMNVAASGLTAERTAMDVTTENLANANTTDADGQPYTPQAVEFQSIGSSSFAGQLSDAMASAGTSPTAQSLIAAGSPGSPGGVEVAQIVSENVPAQLVYDPSSPQANAQGYVKEPNVQPVTEMTNLVDESNSYEADVTAMQTAKTMYQSTLGVLK